LQKPFPPRANPGSNTIAFFLAFSQVFARFEHLFHSNLRVFVEVSPKGCELACLCRFSFSTPCSKRKTDIPKARNPRFQLRNARSKKNKKFSPPITGFNRTANNGQKRLFPPNQPHLTAEPAPTKILYVEAPKKPIIGIVGGIASGKTTVAAEFGKLGCNVIYADEIAHGLLDQPDIETAIIAVFGPEILDSEQNIDRSKLGDSAFTSPEKLTRLNAILHPPVLARAEQLIISYKGEPDVKAIVLDMPLLTEVGWNNKCDKIIFVNAAEDVRARRARSWSDKSLKSSQI